MLNICWKIKKNDQGKITFTFNVVSENVIILSKWGYFLR